MGEELNELDQAIDRCRAALRHEIPEDAPGLLQTFHVLRGELRHLELIHCKMHQLRYFGRLIIHPVMRKLEERDPQVRRQLKREFASVFDFDSDSGVPFNLHGVMPQKRLPQDRLAKGQAIALVIGEGVIELVRSVQEYFKALEIPKGLEWGKGPGWPDVLDELTRLHDSALLDYLHPPLEGQEPFEEELGREVLSLVEKDQESHGSKKLRDDLRDMNPPLTWGEVVYRILRAPENTKGERGRALREFLIPFSRKRYCLECDELFTVSKSSLRLTCPRCSNKLRKRRERASKRASLC